MLELVVLAEGVVAERAEEDPAAVVPHAALALNADGLSERTGTEILKNEWKSENSNCMADLLFYFVWN